MVKPSARKLVARELIDRHSLSERSACHLVGVSRPGFRYRQITRLDDALRVRLKELAAEYPRYGYLTLHGLLKANRLVVNRKKTYRLYTEKALQVSSKNERSFNVLDYP